MRDLEQNLTSDANKAVWQILAGCHHGKSYGQRVSACACFHNWKKNRTNFEANLDMPRTLTASIEMPYGFTILHGDLPTILLSFIQWSCHNRTTAAIVMLERLCVVRIINLKNNFKCYHMLGTILSFMVYTSILILILIIRFPY